MGKPTRKAQRAQGKAPQVVVLPGQHCGTEAQQPVTLGPPEVHSVNGKVARGYLRDACAIKGEVLEQAKAFRRRAEQLEREAEARWAQSISEILEAQGAVLRTDEPAVVRVDLAAWQVAVQRPAALPQGEAATPKPGEPAAAEAKPEAPAAEPAKVGMLS